MSGYHCHYVIAAVSYLNIFIISHKAENYINNNTWPITFIRIC